MLNHQEGKAFIFIRFHSLFLAFILAFSFFGTETVFAKSKVNPYQAPTDFQAVSYSESSAELSWKLDKKLGANAGYQVLHYNPNKKKYVSLGFTEKNNFTVKKLYDKNYNVFKVRTYVKKSRASKKKYYGPAVKLKLPRAVEQPVLTEVKCLGKGKIHIVWESAEAVSGTVIQYSTNKEFKRANTCTLKIADPEAQTTDITGLGKTTYYFKLLTYKEEGGRNYCSPWSEVLSAEIKKGASVKEMLNATATTLSGRKKIKKLTKDGVDIKEYTTTYDRYKAIYNWHALHSQDFQSCLYCSINFAKCVGALYGNNKKYDNFIWIADGNFQNRNGSRPIHKWPVIYLAGIPYVCDPRMQGYTGDYTGNDYFMLAKGSDTEKRFLFSSWWTSYRTKTIFEKEGFVTYKVIK